MKNKFLILIGKDGVIKVQNHFVIDRCLIDDVEALPVADWCHAFDLSL